MIVLGAETELERGEVAEMVRETLEHLGGEVTEEEESDDALLFRFRVPASSIPTLGAYLASGGLLLDDESEQAIGGIASGVLATTLAGTLLVRVPGETSQPPAP